MDRGRVRPRMTTMKKMTALRNMMAIIQLIILITISSNVIGP